MASRSARKVALSAPESVLAAQVSQVEGLRGAFEGVGAAEGARGSVARDSYGATHPQGTLAALGSRIVLHFLPPFLPGREPHRARLAGPARQPHRNHRCKVMTQLLDAARGYLDGYRWRRALERPVARRAA